MSKGVSVAYLEILSRLLSSEGLLKLLCSAGKIRNTVLVQVP